MKNDYEVESIDYSKENLVRVDVRYTAIEQDELTALIVIKEKIENRIFQERLRLSQNVTALGDPEVSL